MVTDALSLEIGGRDPFIPGHRSVIIGYQRNTRSIQFLPLRLLPECANSGATRSKYLIARGAAGS